MLGQGKPKESLGWLPVPSRPASSSRGGGVLERTTPLLCCPNPRAFGEEVRWKPLRGGDWTGNMLSGNEFLSMLASGGGLSSGSPASASDRPSRLIFLWLTFSPAMLAPHETLFLWPKKALISPLGPLPIPLCRRRYGGPVPVARLESSIPATREGTISSQRPSLDQKQNRRAITYSPFLCRALPRNENGRHRRMLDICCPGVYPGVLLWPICHPYILGGAPSRVENAPLRHG
ncbi:hypothetical protein EJ110_NYTH50603 [Nymphaea thermarum]|nr:hypothetical protein EJ110_NYTH50603 [Nymphaea thermarum]